MIQHDSMVWGPVTFSELPRPPSKKKTPNHWGWISASYKNSYPFSHNYGSVENGGVWKVTILLEGPIFDFHDYGRKGKLIQTQVFVGA